ncbi:uncharacterized protein TRAVEDRAFT_133656 [Trametes versicolor FP-101664 SS1]|uniref:uncharacterized protein n=1 Tax=Trametes versicolor (strain FP-101664) TaxID=717944 RepID=UPI0004624125|nr:uncharacterized protein TRAVEDRAFT_133656 [Trametes versicolor FP-101664 SS1]EIW53615.1 hypothetical protein TRAVEDRAFT_133656 [Trametes versicolor FP-101664 SS1]
MPDDHSGPDRAAQSRAHQHLRSKTSVVPFPGNRAGAPIGRPRERSAYEKYQAHIDSVNANPYAPFISAIDWKFARWAKQRGPGSTAVSELLDIENIPELLGLSYKNSRELNTIIDNQLSSGRPRFVRREIVVAGEVFEIFYRDVLQCIRALYEDPEFADFLVFVPEKHYADAGNTSRVYFDMHTGKWWWETQKQIEKHKPGATIIPIIISSDKTQLTVFGSKTAYPVYMTIGNLPKDIRRKPSRRGQILLAYLPTSRLEHIKNKAARRRTLANLFHACMAHVLAPLKKAGIDGIEVTSGDGVTRRGHPIFAMYVGDYPEQLLVTCCKNGTCPKCDIPRDDIGASTDSARPLRDLKKIMNALDKFDSDTPAAFSKACRDAGIKPVVNPFWKDLPYADVYQSITPDILHQLYQGVIKHIVSWLKSAYGPDELDARCRRLPPNHQIRLFLKGITTLQRVTGKEHADICRFLLALIIGLPLPGGISAVRLVRAVRALLDFLYIAQYPAHTSETLELLEDALRRFHTNKEVFVQLGVRQHFKLPKLHSLDHYVQSIKLFGTTDNYDTQYTERLHIDFAKDAYRATNHKDEFPQMTTWLERREKILRHAAYVEWRLRRGPRAQCSIWTRIKITKWPSVKALSLEAAAERYGALYLRDALARFVVQYRNPGLSAAEVEQASLAVSLRFRKIPAFHKLKFALDDAQDLGVMDNTQDVAHARPERKDKQGRTVPGRFDTVLVNDGTGGFSGVQGYHVAQLRLVFKLPKAACQELFPDVLVPGHLAYVERFTPFTAPDPAHGLYKVTRRRDAAGARLATVVEVRNIRRSCHLLPVTGAVVPREWTSSTVLESSESFWVNPFSDLHMYMTLF